MLVLLTLLACADPNPVALATCEALPGLATDPAGLALLEPLLAPDDWEALSKAEPTAGLEAVGAAGLAQLRAQTHCTITSSESAGQGRWAVDLERTAPTVNPDGTLGEPETVTLAWQAVKTPDGVRIEAGIEGAVVSRRNATSAEAEGDLRRAASTWRAIHKKFPDPLLVVDIAAAEARQARAEALGKVRVRPTGVADGKLFVALTNQGAAAVSEVKVQADFAVGAESASVTATWPALEAGATAEVELPVPDGADGNVHVEVTGLAL